MMSIAAVFTYEVIVAMSKMPEWQIVAALVAGVLFTLLFLGLGLLIIRYLP